MIILTLLLDDNRTLSHLLSTDSLILLSSFSPLKCLTLTHGREMSLWTDLDAIVYHGSAEDREMLRKLEFRYTTARKGGGGRGKSGASEDAYKMHVVITTPETCMAADSKTATGRVRRELSTIQVIPNRTPSHCNASLICTPSQDIHPCH